MVKKKHRYLLTMIEFISQREELSNFLSEELHDIDSEVASEWMIELGPWIITEIR